MDIDSPTLLWLTVVGAGVLPTAVAIGVAWRRAIGSRGWGRRLLTGVGILLAVVLAQVMALTAVFLTANRQFALFDTWNGLVQEVVGSQADTTSVAQPAHRQIGQVPITPGNPHPHGQLISLRVKPATDQFSHVSVWLPPAYFEKSQARTHFPVLMVVGSGLTNGAAAAKIFGATTLNERMIQSGAVTPFIAVYVGGSVHRGIDSECTDIPGTAGLDHLVDKVPREVLAKVRATADRRQWFITGSSTGGWCATVAAFSRPDLFGGAASIAGYYHPLYADPKLAGDNALVHKWSVLDQVQLGRTHGVQLLSVLSQKDSQAWGDPVKDPTGVGPDGALFRQAAKDLPGMDFIVLSQGGHEPGVWSKYLPAIYTWFGHLGL